MAAMTASPALIQASLIAVCTALLAVHFLAVGWLAMPAGIVLGIASYLISRPQNASNLLPADEKCVLVTSSDSEFGEQLVGELDAMGFTVFAGCRDPRGDQAIGLKNSSSDRVRLVQLDVTDDRQVQQAMREIASKTRVLWGIVNNAGLAACSPEEEVCSADDFKRVTEINLWGTVRVTKTFLPLVRAARGRVVNIASGVSRLNKSSRVAYSISKHGVESFSDILRMEMAKWGVKVCVIEPCANGYATALNNSQSCTDEAERAWDVMDETLRTKYGSEIVDYYSTLFGSAMAKREQLPPQPGESSAAPEEHPPDLTEAVTLGLLSPSPQILYSINVPWRYSLAALLHRHLPERVMNGVNKWLIAESEE